MGKKDPGLRWILSFRYLLTLSAGAVESHRHVFNEAPLLDIFRDSGGIKRVSVEICDLLTGVTDDMVMLNHPGFIAGLTV